MIPAIGEVGDLESAFNFLPFDQGERAVVMDNSGRQGVIQFLDLPGRAARGELPIVAGLHGLRTIERDVHAVAKIQLRRRRRVHELFCRAPSPIPLAHAGMARHGVAAAQRAVERKYVRVGINCLHLAQFAPMEK